MKSIKKPNAAFGKALAKLRKERGWTQEFLSFECNLTRNYVSLLERGQRSPTLDTMFALARALDLSLTELAAAIEATMAAQS